jgi:hypothetical protein
MKADSLSQMFDDLNQRWFDGRLPVKVMARRNARAIA